MWVKFYCEQIKHAVYVQVTVENPEDAETL